MVKEPKTLLEAIQYFGDDENCRQFMISLYPEGKVSCPHCGNESVSYLEKYKLYFCPKKHAKQKFSLKVGTIFEDSAISLSKWLPAAWLIANCKNGVSSYELARAIGVTQKSAWFMLHRLREAMNNATGFMFGESGEPCEVDESYHGGAPKNRHGYNPKKHAKMMQDESGTWIQNPNYIPHTGKATKKTPVMGILDRETRQVRAKVIPNVDRAVLQDMILDNVAKGSKVYTDGLGAYSNLKALEFVHETVNHVDEYVRGNVHTNGIENFWALLKRTLKGTYVAVEPFHLDGYVTEQVFRYNNRATKDNPLNDADRFALIMSQIRGKRITYAELTGKSEERPF